MTGATSDTAELGVIVDYLAFRCWPPSVLMEKEDLCIQDALAVGVPLVNKTLKCGTLKKSDDYDQIFTPDEQDLFIERIAARQTPLTQWAELLQECRALGAS